MRVGGAAENLATFAIAIGVAIAVRGSAYLEAVALLTVTYAFVALAMYVPFIMGGALSLAYSAFLGIGAYAVALGATRAGLGLAWTLPIGLALAVITATVLGLATRRLSGFYLAAVTLLFGIAFFTWLVDAEGLTGGSAGVQAIPAPALAGEPLSRSDLVTIAIFGVWAVAVLLSRLRGSAFGIAVRAMRLAPLAVESSGIAVGTLVLIALALGAAIAALGGSLLAVGNRAVLPETFVVDLVFLTIFMPLLGGQERPWGAVLGAVLVVTFTFQLTFLKETGSLLFSLAVLLVLIAAPRGILGYILPSRDEPRLRGWGPRLRGGGPRRE
jgi:branched-chain amino acid transport system permease protein